MGAVAHAFSGRITTAMVAAGSSVRDLGPIGSHPLLDPNYGSYWLNVEHDGVRFERIEKIRILSTWKEGLQSLRSCFHPFREPQALNCGHRSTDQGRSKRRNLGNCVAHRAWLSGIFRNGVRLHWECSWKECLDRELYGISPVFENTGILAHQWTYPHAVASQAK